jgi:hypothetical protein
MIYYDIFVHKVTFLSLIQPLNITPTQQFRSLVARMLLVFRLRLREQEVLSMCPSSLLVFHLYYLQPPSQVLTANYYYTKSNDITCSNIPLK